ncbi:MAG: 16S rRNA (uracil(1498)-N(3))-methyltransferase [Pseudobdellovibrionaceae bacterium]
MTEGLSKELHKLIRLYVEGDLSPRQSLTLSQAQSHYLGNVMRRKVGDALRLFNGRDGEYVARIESLSKKEVTVVAEDLIREQPPAPQAARLLVAPIKKARMDFLIEKAVEMGMTDFYTVLTQNTEVRTVNFDRIQAQLIEAAEQCERLDIPRVHRLLKLKETVDAWDAPEQLYAAIEHGDNVHMREQGDVHAVMIGPEGGFTEEEKNWLASHPKVKCISLGVRILRAETAALAALAWMR